MVSLSENYYLRKCFLKENQAPTLTMIKKKMSPALAAVYFKSMSPKLKVVAGLEPKLKGGGSIWYQPPEQSLEGRAVLKPVRKEVLDKLNYSGIDEVGTALLEKHYKTMDAKIEQSLLDADSNWRRTVTAATDRYWDDLVAAATKKNTEQIMKYYNEFVYFYRQSIGKIEILFHESAVAEIKKIRDNSLHEMQIKYSTLLKHQATLIYDEYDKKLMNEKTRLKDEFIQNLEINRTAMAEEIHDLKVNKHMALDKIKQCLHCQNLACEIYVAIKEREDYLKESEVLNREYKKKVMVLDNIIPMQDLQILLEQEKENKQQEFINVWRKKVCHVFKAFQMFVCECLKMFPEQAEFFINMEKLMLLQVDAAMEDSTAPSIIEPEKEQFHTPIPKPKPFYLFCDSGYKPKLEEDLCPKPSNASSASEIPVMIVNKQCLYAACDNFEQFTNKIKEYIHGRRGDDADFEDDLIYEHLVPVKYTPSLQTLEIKLESSLMQVLKQEITDMKTYENVPCRCKECAPPFMRPISVDGGQKIKRASSITPSNAPPPRVLQTIDRNKELEHEREPKWDSFCCHVEHKRCSCVKTMKKNLAEHLPVYMRRMRYGPPEVPDYEICSIKELKTLVEKARKTVRDTPKHVPVAVPSRTKDMSTQFKEPWLDALCTCHSDEFSRFATYMKRTVGPKNEFGSMSPSFMTQEVDTFATMRAKSLRNLVDNFSEVEHIFKKDNCNFK